MLIGAALVGLCVYLGLRSRSSGAVQATPPSVDTPATALVPRSAEPSPSGSVEVAPTTAVLRARSPGEIERQVRNAFDAHRPLIRQRCGSLLGTTPVAVGLNAAFGADGKQIVRGFNEERGSARDGLLKCLQDTVPPLVIEPPGQGERVELRLTLP